MMCRTWGRSSELLLKCVASKMWVFAQHVLPRLLLAALFVQTEKMVPFNRYIHPDEMWLYRNPRREPYVNNVGLWSVAALTPFTLVLLYFIAKREKDDLVQMSLAVTLSLGITCVLTNMVKLIVGRPRPDFFWRCFPDGEMNPEMICSGSVADVIDGRKSFPSGHSSISFSSLGTVSWWIMGKFHVWSSCRGSAWRLIVSGLPLIAATCVALSRTCDYHHHWQDVTVGSLLGLTISYGCYRQHYPSLNSPNCHRPYISHRQSVSTLPRKETSYSMSPYTQGSCIGSCRLSSSSENLADALIEDIMIQEKEKLNLIKQETKWI